MESIKQFLGEIGFGKNEVEIYSALLEINDSASVLDISKRTKIHRSNIYDALRNLLDRGFVYEITEDRKLYKARSPRSIVNYLQRRELELDKIITEFESRTIKKSDTELAKLSKGTFAVREAIKSLLNTGETIYVFGIPGKAPEVIGPMIQEFHKERIKKKIVMKHIYNDSENERAVSLNKMKFTEAKILPPQYHSNATTNIVGNRVIIILWDNPIHVIEMIDSEVAKTYKNYFELVWKKAKDPK